MKTAKKTICRTHDWETFRTSTADLKCRNCSTTTTSKRLFAAQRAANTRRIIRLSRLNDLHEQVVCRLDDGETLEQAVEAVIGSGGPAYRELLAFCGGK